MKRHMKENTYFNNLNMVYSYCFQLKPDLLEYYTTKLKMIITFSGIHFCTTFSGAKTKSTVENEKKCSRKH